MMMKTIRFLYLVVSDGQKGAKNSTFEAHAVAVVMHGHIKYVEDQLLVAICIHAPISPHTCWPRAGLVLHTKYDDNMPPLGGTINDENAC